MNNRVLALRNRAIQINTGSLTNICAFQPTHNLNSTTVSESCMNQEYSYKKRLQILKAELLNQSVEIERALNGTISSMAYEFPIEKAMLYIPEYHGTAKDLDGFLYQIEYFAKQIPEGESEEDLIRTVMFKLKGEAAGSFNRILDDSWNSVKMNLIKVFGEKFSLEAIFQQVETLQQEVNEPFSKYKERVMKLKEHIINNDRANTEDSYALKNLKIHFLAGLKNPELKTLARTNKHLSFDELLEYLQEEVVQIEHIRKIEERLNRTQFFETYSNESSMNPCQNSYNYTYPNNQTAPNVDCSTDSRKRCDNGNSSLNHSHFNNFGIPQHNSTTYNTNPPNFNNNYSRPRRYFTPYRNNNTQNTIPQNNFTQGPSQNNLYNNSNSSHNHQQSDNPTVNKKN